MYGRREGGAVWRSGANDRTQWLWLSRLVLLVPAVAGLAGWVVWRLVERCFRVWREQATMKRSGGALPRAALGRAASWSAWRTEGEGREGHRATCGANKRNRTVGGSSSSRSTKLPGLPTRSLELP